MNQSARLLDTSVLIRLLTRDPLPLFKTASGVLDQWTEGMPGLIVTDLVLSESYYALQHHYSFPKADAIEALRSMAGHPAIAVSPQAKKILSLPNLAAARPGFVDRLIHGAAQASGAILLTFEKSARKLPNTRILEG